MQVVPQRWRGRPRAMRRHRLGPRVQVGAGSAGGRGCACPLNCAASGCLRAHGAWRMVDGVDVQSQAINRSCHLLDADQAVPEVFFPPLRPQASAWPAPPTTCTSWTCAPESGRRWCRWASRPARAPRMLRRRWATWWSCRAASAPQGWPRKTCMCWTSQIWTSRAGTGGGHQRWSGCTHDCLGRQLLAGGLDRAEQALGFRLLRLCAQLPGSPRSPVGGSCTVLPLACL